MHPADIKYELARADYTQTDVASECGVRPGTISAVIHGRSRSKKIESRIAAIVRITPAELWPQWYAPSTSGAVTPLPLDDQLRIRLQSELGRLRLTHEALASMWDTSPEQIRALLKEGGQAMPTVSQLLQLGATTRIDLAYLMTGRREH
jgi:lambda repressor-like predicted transcriptional regulator